MATLALTAALTFGPVATADSGLLNAECPEPLIEFWSTCITPHAARWIPTAYREEAAHDSTSGDVTAPPPTTGVEQWRPLVAAYWPTAHVDRMLRIMACESNGNPDAYNPGHGEKGLFQIHPLWQKAWPGDYYDPWTNAAVAYQIWLTQGYAAWVCKG